MEKKSNEIRTKHNKLHVGNRAELKGCNEPMFRIGYNTPLYTYTDERSAKAEP